MQFPKKNPDFDITCLDGIAKVHRFLVENITDYFTHEKPFLECNMVIVNYIMDVLYYDIRCKHIGEYKLTTMDTTSIINVCGILNISNKIQKKILSSMFREDIYADAKNDMLSSFCIIINRFPKLLHVLAKSNFAKSRLRDISFDLLEQLTKNAIAINAVETLKPIFDVCTSWTLSSLANKFSEIRKIDLIRIETGIYMLEHHCSIPVTYDLYDSLLLDKLQASEIKKAGADLAPIFVAIVKRLEREHKDPHNTKIINVCTLLSKFR